ncbi:MAG: hypothetical protein PPP56_03950 [Longimonas sp.]|uniref:hypothetical protein n=1 Tax=Longimonas sp. TaxID=2039626 RepID=UPI00334E5217
MTGCLFLDDNDRALKSEGDTATSSNDEVLAVVNKRNARIWIVPVDRDAMVAIGWVPRVGSGRIAPDKRQAVVFDEIAIALSRLFRTGSVRHPAADVHQDYVHPDYGHPDALVRVLPVNPYELDHILRINVSILTTPHSVQAV